MSEEAKEDGVTLEALRAKAVVVERPFTSANQMLGQWIVRFRNMWNAVATLWYVRPLVDQQNRFNQLLLHFLEQKFYAAQVQMNTLQGRLDHVDLRLEHDEKQIWLQSLELREQKRQSDDQSMRLVWQDRDLITAVHDSGELSTQLTQLSRQLQRLEERLERLENQLERRD